MENECLTDKKNTFKLPFMDTVVELSGNFDSGNLNSVSIDQLKNELQVSFGKDKDIKPSSKCWFHFWIQADSNIPDLKMCLVRVNTLSAASKVVDLYRPVVKEEGGEWARLGMPVEFESQVEGDTCINMRMQLSLKAGKKFYIALTYPWSFTENEEYIENIEMKMRKRNDIYFNRETLVMSRQGRPLHLIAISGPDCFSLPSEKYIQHLFPKNYCQDHFKQVRKPLVMITSRVHPGQVGASHALKGMVEWLLGDSKEANKLRAEFYFLIVPMLNPDGVFLGNNRMDSLGQNLNRFYHLPDLQLQPSCYAVKSLLELTRRQVFAFFDLHGHANKKSCFLFGNNIPVPRLQMQSVLLAKYFSSICDNLEFKSCNFSKKQMSTKDKNEDLSKEGCARVVVHRWSNSPYCYTLQTGLFKDVRTDEKGILRFGQKFYDPTLYQELGKKMLISFGAILNKDKSLDDMRKFCTDYVARLDKPVKKQKSSTVKSLKSVGKLPQETQAEEKAVTVQRIGVKDTNRGQQVRGVLRKNKGILMDLKNEDDDE